MKKIYTLLLSVIILQLAHAQNPIPNPSFERWTNSLPDTCQFSSAITQSTNKHSGQYAAQGEKTNISGDPDLSIGVPIGAVFGFPVTAAFPHLNFYYIFNKAGTDAIIINVVVKNAATNVIGTSVDTINNATASYKAASFPITYTGGSPATCSIDITLKNNTVGSYFIIDDIALSNVAISGIDNPAQDLIHFSLTPNPANNQLTVLLQQDRYLKTNLQLFDMAGKEIKAMETISGKTTIDISDVPQGIYVVALKQEGNISTRKIQIVR